MEQTGTVAPRFAADLLLLYFEHLSTAELVTSSHVCRNWRVLVYKRSKFTSHVLLNSTADTALARFTAQLDAQRSCRLSVALRIATDDAEFVTRALCILTRQLSRVWRLSLHLNAAQASALWEALRFEAPQMASFYLSLSGQPTSASITSHVVPADIFGGYASMLREIALTDVRLPAQAPLGLTNASVVSLFEKDRLEISLTGLMISFPKLDRVNFRKPLQGRAVILEEPDYVQKRTLFPTVPRFTEIYLRLHDDAKDIINNPWALSLFQTVIVCSPTDCSVSACLEILPPGALHLALRPCLDENTFIIDIRSSATDRVIRFEESRHQDESGWDRLCKLYVRGRWLERVTDVTIALSIWSHPHFAQWVPRLPSARRVGVILDSPADRPTSLTPVVALNCPSLARLDLATLHGVHRIPIRDIESLLESGFVQAPQRIALGVCDGVSVSGPLDGVKITSLTPLPRFRGLPTDMW